MLRVVKLVISLLLMACLFLPLSTCSREPTKIEIVQGTATETLHYNNHVITAGETRIGSYLIAVPFVLPLLLAVLGLFRREIWLEVLNILCAFSVVGVVIIHAFIAKLALGGYLAMGSALACLAGAVISIRQIVVARRTGHS